MEAADESKRPGRRARLDGRVLAKAKAEAAARLAGL